MNRARLILVVDDEENIRKFLAKSLRREKYDVRLAGSEAEASAVLERERPDLIVLDVRLPDANGMEMLRSLRRRDPDLPIIIITAYGEIKMAVEAMRDGAFDFVTKPFDFNTLHRSIEKAIQIVSMREELTALKSVWERGQYMGLIGQSPVMMDLFRTIERIGTSASTTVLITGETGSGKEVVARAIHEKSDRCDSPFVAINCATLDDHLLESELFGHIRGAFTDAKTNKPGLFEVADRGTIFLDEIGEMDLRLQAKLLRVLEDKTFRRVGGTRDIQVDVRVIAASNVSLEDRVREGRFREDLFYRLSVIPVRVPPLRERGDDVVLLGETFLKRYTHEFSRSILGFTQEAKDALISYRWPGNVRELRNMVERMVLLEEKEVIDLASLPPAMGKVRPQIIDLPEGLSLEPFHSAKNRIIGGFEREYLEALLRASGGNVTQAAAIAEIDRSSLQRLFRKYGLSSQAFRSVPEPTVV
jgi:DNA-binding NtrC family response regulator